MEPVTSPSTLQYASGRRRRRWGRWTALAVLVVGTGAAVWHWRADLDRWQSLVRLRHAVLTGNVTFDRPAVSQAPSDTEDGWLAQTIAHLPDARLWWQAQADLVPALARGEPGPPTLLFLHGRTTPAGVARAVVVHASPMSTRDAAYLSLYVRLFDPGTIAHPGFREVIIGPVHGMKIDGTIPGFPGVRLALSRIAWHHAMTLSVGRPDPSDASQFLIDYTVDDHAGQIVGRLNDDDGLTFRTADGTPLPLVAK